ncbi:dihydroneopterin aldolase [Cucumibacter marinus]|uniref:dihydroneopterin aldolase n=1 Tax=Cucumibacter marinus TaxID=1121252 RepID=UPI000403D529|nr:dihydroneopterin aldolase [Cucumibacter marinus]
MAQADKIILSDLAFYGYHGVMLEENSLGQRFRLDIECGVDLSTACQSDDVNQTISYVDIFSVIQTAFEERRFKLIEALAQHIADRLFDSFEHFEWVRIRVRKPEAPIPVVVGEFAIEIFRERTNR